MSTTTIIVVLLVAVAAFILLGCKITCKNTEGYSHRVPATHLLAASEAYSINPQDTDYSQKWGFEVAPNVASNIENYSDIYECNRICRDSTGAMPRSDCMRECMNSDMGLEGSNMQECVTHSDCHWNDICVRGIGSSRITPGGKGYCVDPNEPGVPWADHPVSDLTPGVPVLRPGFAPLTPSMQKLTPGVPVLRPGFAPLTPSMQKLTPGVPVLRPGFAPLTPSMQKLTPGVPVLRPGFAPLTPGVPVLRPGLAPVTPSMRKMTPGLAGLYTDMGKMTAPIADVKPRTCPPSQFYNTNTGLCESRFQ